MLKVTLVYTTGDLEKSRNMKLNIDYNYYFYNLFNSI
jgi:hypothetical protein